MTREEVEIWRDIPGYEGAYQASSLGRIRSVPRRGQRIGRLYGGRVLIPNSAGPRLLVTLSVGNQVKTIAVHKLVCLAFHGPRPEGKQVVAHWDGDHLNNRADNLRWATYVENEADKRRHGRHPAGERNPSRKLTAREVREIRARHDGRHGTGARLAREYGISKTQVSAIRRGRSWAEEATP